MRTSKFLMFTNEFLNSSFNKNTHTFWCFFY